MTGVTQRRNGIRGAVAVAGIGETTYYKHGHAAESEYVLALKAILRAAEDAGIDPRDIDGFASYSNDRNDPSRIAAALGIRELRLANMHWGGGGGGVAAAIANGAAAIVAGFAECVVVFRALAQGQFRRFGEALPDRAVTGDAAYLSPYGVLSPAQKYAMRATRFMHDYGIGNDALRAIAMASYNHAQRNPRAIRYGRPLDRQTYDESRWIVEPVNRLYDCCQENDGAAALILVSAERAKDLPKKPAYILAAAQGSEYRSAAPALNSALMPTASFSTVAPRLYEAAGLTPADIDVVQSYENFTTGVLMAIVEHGFCSPGEADEFFTLENLSAPSGRMPLNTSGGNLAEGYVHGLGLQLEAVRQIRGDSSNQVPNAKLALTIGGPMVSPVSSLIMGSEETLL
ncbi:thiolase C-terminal domain-containing protein [Oceanibacterium hippocampi]|uniref:Lipid-transfer protein n=1 Tax=Oceanibacterium hippocampi TaxID=745714 RepID=A0A1Y5TMM4_9PROT|nr:acetyl-CoA acetyltransferase [Oceanibacterium hippocampi]SLN67153.1 lipid-transfer protein [Oceanibacterium hippocampi]